MRLQTAASHTAIQHNSRDPLGVGVCIGKRDGRASRHAEHGEPVQTGGLDERLEIGEPPLQ